MVAMRVGSLGCGIAGLWNCDCGVVGEGLWDCGRECGIVGGTVGLW